MIKMNNGALIISLDFEMTWGGVGVWDNSKYKETHVANVRDVVVRLLDIFKRNDIHATFATVGLLMLEDKSSAKGNIPSYKPSYINYSLSPFENKYIEKINDEKLYFAPDLIDLLKKYDNVEIGTHTFSHYYCWEKGQTIKQFEADIEKSIEVASANGIELRSIVFPRNQVSKEYLEVCKKYGITSYRGNAIRFYNKTSNPIKNFFNKIGRFLDSYFSVGYKTTYKISDIDNRQSPLNLRASRFLRPYSNSLHFLESLKIKRICREIEYAAKHNEIYHLWWHPHNFGNDVENNLKALQTIISCFAKCREKYEMQSYTMQELSIRILH